MHATPLTACKLTCWIAEDEIQMALEIAERLNW